MEGDFEREGVRTCALEEDLSFAEDETMLGVGGRKGMLKNLNPAAY